MTLMPQVCKLSPQLIHPSFEWIVSPVLKCEDVYDTLVPEGVLCLMDVVIRVLCKGCLITNFKIDLGGNITEQGSRYGEILESSIGVHAYHCMDFKTISHDLILFFYLAIVHSECVRVVSLQVIK